MAKMTGEKRDANLAACVIQIAWVMERMLSKELVDPPAIINRLKAIQEIALQCIDSKQEQEAQESIAAIEAYSPPIEAMA